MPRKGRGGSAAHDSSIGGSHSGTPTDGFGGPSHEDITPGGSSLKLTPAPIQIPHHHSSGEPSNAETSSTQYHHHKNSGGRQGRGRIRGIGRGIRGGNLHAHHELGNEAERVGERLLQPNGGNAGGVGFQNGTNTTRFIGRLTRTEETASPGTSTLQADAPEFHPGQKHQPRLPNGVRGGRRPIPDNIARRSQVSRGRRQSTMKSSATDIGTRVHEDINNGIYECPICTNEVGRSSKVWSCTTCWTVFHLSCIKKWSTNEGSTQAQRRTENGDLHPPRQWRCPGCNLPKDTLPSTYNCWCTKEAEPRSVSGTPPHSCGQTCGKSRLAPKPCPHPCELLCHAGPCPPCPRKGPVQSCYCGKTSATRKCVDTNHDSGWSCGQVCGDLMPCGEHTCQQPCHEGLCGACIVPSECRCYCGKVKQVMTCCERADSKASANDEEEWTGTFDCKNGCLREYDCGKHHCEKQCHPQNNTKPHCPRSPDVVNNCPCGKTSLQDILVTARSHCEDSIPNCDKKCLKKLPCGHACQQICHSNECKPCLVTAEITCRCGRTRSSTLCHQGSEQKPQCIRTCKASLNCGRHECGERCCSGERKAAERQATKRKLRPLGLARTIDDNYEAEHICTRLCGRMLKCSNHTCPELCHKGPCGSCREAIFEEIGCDCGKTVLQPPLPCGTTAPPCRFECERPKDCGHPRVPHNCHSDSENCPKCPFLGMKPCLCGKKMLKNQPCWLTEVRCGDVCGRTLRCGSHLCRKQCHRPGECEDVGKVCEQACGKAKKVCGHPCEVQCHAPSSCREDKPCQNKMLITCECQHLKQEVKCNASKTGEGNSQKTLSCDDECARLLRNQKLAQALNIEPGAHKDDHIPYAIGTLKMFRENVKWAQVQEREFRVFASDDIEKRLRFKPMLSYQRAFVHALAEDFGFDSESMDPEPHRHVAVFKTPRFVMAPMKTLAECVRIRASAESANATAIESQKKLQMNNEMYNAFLMTNPKFGLTIEDLRIEFASSFNSTPNLAYEILFLPSEAIVIKPKAASTSNNISASAIEATIKVLKAPLATTVASKRVAASIQLCALDSSLNLIRCESDDSALNGGWSQVAAKAAAPRFAPRQNAVGEKSVYTVLGSKVREAKRIKEQMSKAKEQEIVDDWEEEMRKEEAAEAKANEEAQISDAVPNGMSEYRSQASEEGCTAHDSVKEPSDIRKDLPLPDIPQEGHFKIDEGVPNGIPSSDLASNPVHID